MTGAVWGLFLPVGSVFFGLFLNSRMLEKEEALFDEEHRVRRAAAQSRDFGGVGAQLTLSRNPSADFLRARFAKSIRAK